MMPPRPELKTCLPHKLNITKLKLDDTTPLDKSQHMHALKAQKMFRVRMECNNPIRFQMRKCPGDSLDKSLSSRRKKNPGYTASKYSDQSCRSQRDKRLSIVQHSKEKLVHYRKANMNSRWPKSKSQGHKRYKL